MIAYLIAGAVFVFALLIHHLSVLQNLRRMRAGIDRLRESLRRTESERGEVDAEGRLELRERIEDFNEYLEGNFVRMSARVGGYAPLVPEGE